MFDPEHPQKSLILKEGKVEEVTDLDVEQGGDVEMTGLEEETVTENTVDDIKDRRESKEGDDEPHLETEKYRLEKKEKKDKEDKEDKEEVEVEEEEEEGEKKEEEEMEEEEEETV